MGRRLGILLSGRGSNFEAIADAVDSGTIRDAEIAAVISDMAAARGLEPRAEHEAEILRILDQTRVDLVCLAGYMRILSPAFVERWRGRALNIHPSLLPKYRGTNPQRRALEAGDKVSGCTVHFVDEGTDTGPVVLQKAVRIEPGDTEETLIARILVEEHRAYPEAIAKVLDELGGAR
jgi:phosphoribosylglycinamide formyltransferase 1